MHNLEHLPHNLDEGKFECQTIVETPKGQRNKFKFLPESGLFTLSRVLPEGFSFPFDFGFIPSTKAEDGDALDLLVLMDEPAHVGCLLTVRLIGVVQTVQTEKGKKSINDRLIGVAVQSFAYQDAKSISDVRKNLVDQISEFLELNSKNTDKEDRVTGVGGPEVALKLLKEAIRKFEEEP